MIDTKNMKKYLLSGLVALLPLSAPVLAIEDGEEASQEDSSWIAIQGGDVYTGTGSILRGATVLAEDGKIVEIGYDLYVPEEAEVIDAGGYRVYPGLVAISSFGLFGGGTGLQDTVDPFNRSRRPNMRRA